VSQLVVVGYDGSNGAEAALRVALSEARARGATLRVVGVWHVTAPLKGSTAAPTNAAKLGEEVRTGLTRAIDAAVAGLRAEAPELAVEGAVREGQPAAVLTDEAEGADLLVLGSRGLGGFRELLLGSVSHQCAQHARCPVLIVPGGTAKPRPERESS
jgi:nucleotide-binding universal stress UspA family protein